MRIMIVDDLELLEYRLESFLNKNERATHTVKACNTMGATDLFHSFKPELVILDISLPDGNGLELLRKFKALNPDVMIIMAIIISNDPIEKFWSRCLELDAGHLQEKSKISGLISVV